MLSFDFAVLEGGSAVGLIEFQGRHHYEAITYFGGEEAHKEVIVRDEIKRAYCESRGLPLMVVPHWHLEKISELIKDFLFRLKRDQNVSC